MAEVTHNILKFGLWDTVIFAAPPTPILAIHPLLKLPLNLQSNNYIFHNLFLLLNLLRFDPIHVDESEK